MRIHTNLLNQSDLARAASIARVEIVTDVSARNVKGSRSRAHAFDVKLEGASNRRPNGGASGAGSGYAATWDQWGVFLAALFEADPEATCWAYKSAEDFADQTADRFGAPEVVMTADGYREVFTAYGWPADAHGDHTFRWSGSHTSPREQSCTRCSAVKRWSV